APARGRHGPAAVRPLRVAGRKARCAEAPVLAEAAPRHRRRHRPHRRVGADRQGFRRRRGGRPAARPGRRASDLPDRRRSVRPGRRLRRDHADATRSALAVHRRARPDGPAEGHGVWSAGLQEPSNFVLAHRLAAPIGAETPRRFTRMARV
ncbi:MAG: Mobile element protein, partial [uncultured Craurococcus sp.]